MSLQSFYKSMPSGFAGDILAVDGSLVEPGKFDTTLPPVSPGVPVKVRADGYMAPLDADDAISTIYGLFGRCVPKVGEGLTSTFGPNPVNKSYLQGILVWGYQKVLVAGSVSPIRGRAVYVRNLSGVSAYPIGTFAATPIDITFSEAPNIIWAESDADEYGIGIVRFLGPLIAGSGGTVSGGLGITIT